MNQKVIEINQMTINSCFDKTGSRGVIQNDRIIDVFCSQNQQYSLIILLWEMKKYNSQFTLRFSIWEIGEMELPCTETEKTMEKENQRYRDQELSFGCIKFKMTVKSKCRHQGSHWVI